MKRAEKKKRLKEKQRRQEAHRRARLEADAGDAAGQGPPAAPAENELKDAARDSKAFLAAARDEHAEGVKAETAAREKAGLKPSRRITNERALEMLEKAAEYAEAVIDITREVLDQVPPERKLEAVAMIRESNFAKAASDRERHGTPQKKARRGSDPVVTLMKIGLQASGLLNRILAKINPDVAKLAKAA